MDESVTDRVVALAADVFGEDRASMSGSTTPDDLESWDSLAQLNLLVALEDEFDILISPDDMEQMTSIGAVADLVRSLQ